MKAGRRPAGLATHGQAHEVVSGENWGHRLVGRRGGQPRPPTCLEASPFTTNLQLAKMKRIVCVGAVYIDTILTVPHFPIEDQKLRATKLARRRGGNCANTLEVLQQLVEEAPHSQKLRKSHSAQDDAELYLISVLPARRSDAARYILDSLSGVELDRACIFREGPTEAAASYIINNKEHDTRTIISINELPEMTPDEFLHQNLEISADSDSTWYHFEGRMPDITNVCIQQLRSSPDFRHSKISIECEKPERRGLTSIVQHADVVFYSRLWAESYGYQSAEDFLQSELGKEDLRTNALLCCTWGAAGATIVQNTPGRSPVWASTKAWKNGDDTEQSPIVDSIGAGDTFVAGMLFALNYHQDDWDLQQKLQFANELAGRKVYQEGFNGLGKAISTAAKSCEIKAT
ncbi:Ribokinase-like protein [Massariosphaeria phaeospora]|uniref:Ribokinase-like protein n=1 Tax=Massariosphaeria phaeospora TaxID=100035 RepID=A0A7C8MIB3_9PLEO|nr:Ribokinase-like protein [Massariosphaeria phaeospora]